MRQYFHWLGLNFRTKQISFDIMNVELSTRRQTSTMSSKLRKYSRWISERNAMNFYVSFATRYYKT